MTSPKKPPHSEAGNVAGQQVKDDEFFGTSKDGAGGGFNENSFWGGGAGGGMDFGDDPMLAPYKKPAAK